MAARSTSPRGAARRPLSSAAIGACLALAIGAALALAACGGGEDDASGEGPELLTSDGFEQALSAVEDEAGEHASLIRVQLTGGSAEFQLRDGEGARGLFYAGGELEPVEVQVLGAGALDEQEFSLSDVDAGAVDAIADAIADRPEGQDAEVAALTLQRRELDGELGWVADTQGPGGSLVWSAAADGSGLSESFALAPDGQSEQGAGGWGD